MTATLTTVVELIGGALAFGFIGMRFSQHIRSREDSRFCVLASEERIDRTAAEMDKASARMDWIEKRCTDTYSNDTGTHRCVDEIGHTGIHFDDTLGWYGEIEYPPPVPFLGPGIEVRL